MACPARFSPEGVADQGQVLVLVVQHVHQVDKALLHGDRAIGQQGRPSMIQWSKSWHSSR
jgi:hypothetical protein